MDIVKLCLPSECLPDCIQPTCGALYKVSAVLLICPHGTRDRAVRGELQQVHVKQPLAAGLRLHTRGSATPSRARSSWHSNCATVWRSLPGIQAAIKCMTSLICMREGRHAPFGARSSCREGCTGVVGADCATSCLPAPPWVSRALLPDIACMQVFIKRAGQSSCAQVIRARSQHCGLGDCSASTPPWGKGCQGPFPCIFKSDLVPHR